MTEENISWSNLKIKNVARLAGVKPATFWSPVGRASSWATKATHKSIICFKDTFHHSAVQLWQQNYILYFHIYPKHSDRKVWEKHANPDLMPHSAASDQGLHFSPLIQQFIDTSTGSKMDFCSNFRTTCRERNFKIIWIFRANMAQKNQELNEKSDSSINPRGQIPSQFSS